MDKMIDYGQELMQAMWPGETGESKLKSSGSNQLLEVKVDDHLRYAIGPLSAGIFNHRIGIGNVCTEYDVQEVVKLRSRCWSRIPMMQITLRCQTSLPLPRLYVVHDIFLGMFFSRNHFQVPAVKRKR